MENYTVDYEHNIKEYGFNDVKGTISVWEQRILKKWKGNTMYCTVTDKEDLIEYDIDITIHGQAYEGKVYRIDAVKKSDPTHWIILYVTLGCYDSGKVFVEPCDASMNPEFDYNDIMLAVEDYATNNLYK